MPLQLTPLEQVDSGVARVVGPEVPGPAKMMAAKGLAPLPPAHLATAIYQLCADPDPKIVEAARATATKLPENILGAALAENLDPRVIEFFTLTHMGNDGIIQKVLLNPATHDETFVTLAQRLTNDELLQILANNQQRLLRYPQIIEAYYFNRAARMSTVDRLIEMAIRNGLVLESIPQFADMAAAIMGKAAVAVPAQDPLQAEQEQVEAMDELDKLAALDAAADGFFDAAITDDIFGKILDEGWDQGSVGLEDQEEEKEEIPIRDLSINQKIRLAILGNSFHRSALVKDTNRLVRMAVIKSPTITDNEVVKFAGDKNCSEDVIRYISEKRDWLKSYQVKKSLIQNPKTPIQTSIRFLAHLRANDLRQIARSKQIPGALAKAAKSLQNKRG